MSTRIIHIVKDVKDRKRETILYWSSRSVAERIEGIVQATAAEYAMAGKVYDASRRSERPITRIQPK